MRLHSLAIALLISMLSLTTSAQDIDLSYYLPDITYDQSIPTPLEFLGHEVGEMHVTHDKLYYYMKELADRSDRITLTEYARSHEKRPLIYLTVTSPSNHGRIDDIKAEHKKLTNTSQSESVDIENMPIIIYQGCSIHGNEPSGSNGALATMYYLAAGQGAKIDQLLNDVVILFDPSFNPDGLQRFSTWVNTHKGKHLISDPNSREYTEAWPRGRTNHYWFDLNRDWLLLTHPESVGRIRTFHEWKPDILTDHHEMGSNSTFFFQPGIPDRTNPNTPLLNQELTYEVAKYHGKALDKIGSLYYTKESFDDYYYGKGSTYPDAQGCIGILFEQASSRGHLQETDNGLLTFPFTIRNQVTTMLSTQDAAVGLRKQILDYKRQSFLEARQLAKKNNVKGYAFGDPHDHVKVNRFIEILLSHQIEVHKLSSDIDINGTKLTPNNGYAVALDQDQYRLAKSIFEKVTTFKDSLFYDVSAWTLPLAYDIPYQEMKSGMKLGDRVTAVPTLSRKVNADEDVYAYLIEWDSYHAPRALKTLLAKGVIVKLANEAFVSRKHLATMTAVESGKVSKMDAMLPFDRGTLIIPTGNNQSMSKPELRKLMDEICAHNTLNVTGVPSGLVESGVNLGSRSLGTLENPKALMLIGNGVNSNDAGQLWHHVDQNLEMAIPMIDVDRFSRIDLSNYNTIIMPDGNYNALNGSKEKLTAWIRAGGNIIAIKGAIRWLKNQDIVSLDYQTDTDKSKKDAKKSKAMKAYAGADEARGAKFTGGMIAMIDIDVTHPLFYGYHRSQLPVFKRGNDYFKTSTDAYNTPGRYSKSPVLSGYLHKDNEALMPGATSVFSTRMGRGKIIGLVDNPVFRGYFWGNNKLFANALFFGHSY